MSFEQGKLETYIRSEAAPDEDDPYDPMKILVGSTITDYLKSRQIDVGFPLFESSPSARPLS